MKLTVTGTQQRPNCSMLLAAHFPWRRMLHTCPSLLNQCAFPSPPPPPAPNFPRVRRLVEERLAKIPVSRLLLIAAVAPSPSRSDASLDWKSKRRRFPKEPSQDAAKPNRSPNPRLPHRQSPLQNISARGVIDAFNHHRPSTLFKSVWS